MTLQLVKSPEKRIKELEFALRPFARLLAKLELEHLPDSVWLEVVYLDDATAPAPGQLLVGQLRRAKVALAE